jgi:hypothetical protein
VSALQEPNPLPRGCLLYRAVHRITRCLQVCHAPGPVILWAARWQARHYMSNHLSDDDWRMVREHWQRVRAEEEKMEET